MLDALTRNSENMQKKIELMHDKENNAYAAEITLSLKEKECKLYMDLIQSKL